MAAEVVHSAQFVGDAFARQYYAVLQHSPELVHCFYKDMSKIGRIDTDTGLMLSTTTMNAINEKILSYGSFTADVKSVDAQESYNDGVIVLVNGAMVNEDDSRRNFTQTFFLAPQATGYYVLSDIFRFVNDDDPGSNEQDGGISPVTSDQEPPSTEEDHHSEQSNGEVYNSSGELPVEVVKEEFQVEEKFEEKELLAEAVDESPQESWVMVDSIAKEPVAEVVEEIPQESWVVAESSAKVEGTSKKSYASIVRNDAPATMSFSTPPKSVSKIQEHQAPELPALKSVAVPPSSNGETVADVNSEVLEGGSHSIYVRNLPVNITVSVVEQVFQGFGPISRNGIQVLPHRGFFREGQYASCFGFVKFETAAAAQKAIEASPIFIGGQKVGIEEKKSTVVRRAYSYDGNNPRRYPQGERGGSSLPGEAGRGRGGYEDGRGYGGQGGDNKSEFGGRRGGYEEGRGYGGQGDGNKSEFGGKRGGYGGRGYGGRGDGNKSDFGGRRGGYGGGRGYGGRGDGNKTEYEGSHGGSVGARGHGGQGDGNKSQFGGRRVGSGRGYQTRSEGYQKSDQTGNKSGGMNCGVESSHMSTRPRLQRVSA